LSSFPASKKFIFSSPLFYLHPQVLTLASREFAKGYSLKPALSPFPSPWLVSIMDEGTSIRRVQHHLRIIKPPQLFPNTVLSGLAELSSFPEAARERCSVFFSLSLLPPFPWHSHVTNHQEDPPPQALYPAVDLSDALTPFSPWVCLIPHPSQAHATEMFPVR